MSEKPTPNRSSLHRGRVLRVEWVTPHMIRVVLGGEGLVGSTWGSTPITT